MSKGSPIMIGYQWRQRVAIVGAAAFPSGSALRAQVRSDRTSTAVLSTLSTANSGIVRVSDTEIDLVIPAADTATMRPGTVLLDLTRTDVDPDQHFGFTLRINVVQPVTRPA